PSQPTSPAPVSPSTEPATPSPSAGTSETGSTSSDEVAAVDPLQALVAQLDQIDTATLSEAEREELEGLTDAVLLAVDAGVQAQIDAAIAQVQTWLAAHSPSQPTSPAPVSPSTHPTSPSPSAGTGETGSTSSSPVSQPAATVESKQEEEISKPISTQPTAGTGETGSTSSSPVSQPASTVESKQEEEISSSVKPISTEGEQGDVQAGQTETSSETDKVLEEESVSHVNSEATEVVTKEEELITFVPAYAPQMAALPEGQLPEIVFAKGESTKAPSLPVLELPNEEGVTKETVRHTSPQPVSSQAPLSQSVGKKDVASAKALPQTGQSSNQEWLLLGGLVGLFGLAKLRKKEDM
ncbi:TPA: LPXTG cell wall anchor domain-containing protein, partial [Streptococcus suis]